MNAYKKLFFRLFSFLSILALAMVACDDGPPVERPHPWQRSDMPIAGLDRLVTYNLNGPANGDSLVNMASDRGVNENSPHIAEQTIFNQMSGTKTQDVEVADMDGIKKWSLGMVKSKRFAGLSEYITLEPATFTARDINGKFFCGAKVRLDFKKNFFQLVSDAVAANQRDYQSLWYYEIPCAPDNSGGYTMDIENARLVSLVINEVWQFRLMGNSLFSNFGHSITVIDGLPTTMEGGWWEHWDIPDNSDHVFTSDAMGAAQIANNVVLDLEASERPWLEFKLGGEFDRSGSYLIYSAGDADQWATFDRVFLNRQGQYVVFYRPVRSAQWDWIRIEPLYNLEWNDVLQELKGIKDLTFDNQIDEKTGLASPDNTVVKELERAGWMNAPNVALDQVRWWSSSDQLLFAMTVRAHIGARDTLLIFSRGVPNYGDRALIPLQDNQPWPALHDQYGNPLPDDQQDYTAQQWAEWQRENSFWDYLKDNPNHVSGDLEVQYRFGDNSTWKERLCRRYDEDNKPVDYVCGYDPVQWDLSTSYYMDGDTRGPWLAIQTLGEVGVRTLGFSYASGLYQGTGLNFALAQEVHRNEYLTGYADVESLWRFDARAEQTPATLAEAWAFLHNTAQP